MAKQRAARSKVTLDGALMFPNDYVAAVELKGKDVTLTIAAVSKESLQMSDGGKKEKMVIRFERTTKKLVCNKTNADSIAQIYGTEASKWCGKRVTFFPTRCLAFGDMVDCVRVREKAPPALNGEAPKATPAATASGGSFPDTDDQVADDALAGAETGELPDGEPDELIGGTRSVQMLQSLSKAKKVMPNLMSHMARLHPDSEDVIGGSKPSQWPASWLNEIDAFISA